MTSPTPRARLAVHVGRDVPTSLAAVLSAASSWVDVVAASPQEGLPDGVRAHVYTSDVLPPRPDAPYAAWLVPGRRPVHAPAVVVGEAGSPDLSPGDLVVCTLPWPERSRLLLPFTRSRYRLLRDLPESMVAVATPGGITWSSGGTTPTRAPDSGWPTLAALASAVVARGDLAWDALAWGAPTVTDPETARRLSLTPDEHVLVADDPTERRRLALALATDTARAAGLARRGWSAARARRPEEVAGQLCRLLALAPPRCAPSGLRDALDALDTPAHSLIRRRAREAVATLPGAVTSGWQPDQRSDRDQP